MYFNLVVGFAQSIVPEPQVREFIIANGGFRMLTVIAELSAQDVELMKQKAEDLLAACL